MNRYTLKISLLFLVTLSLLSGSAFAKQESISQQLAGLSSLDLATAKRLALEGSPTIKVARERVTQATYVVNQKKAAFLPQVDAGASLTRKDTSANSESDTTSDTYATSLSASLTLFDGFSRRYSLDSARHSKNAYAKALEEARHLLLLNVSKAFFTLQTAVENINIAESSRAYNARLLLEAEASRKAGAGSLSDVLSFKIEVNKALATLAAEKKNLAVAQTALAVLMGSENGRLPQGLKLAPLSSTPKSSESQESPEVLLKKALAGRPDFLQALATIEKATSTTQVARSGYYPTVTLAGTVSGTNTGSATLGSDDFDSSLALKVNLNLFSGGQTRAQVAEAISAEREARQTASQLKLTITQEVYDALASLASAKEQAALQAETVAFTRRSRDLVEEEYRAGQSTTVKLNEAQNNLVSAKGNLVSAQIALLTARETLKKVIGEIDS